VTDVRADAVATNSATGEGKPLSALQDALWRLRGQVLWRRGQSVEDVAAEIAFGDMRVVEVVGRVMSHAKPVHHGTGVDVRLSRVGDELVKVEFVEGEGRSSTRCFGHEARSPGFSRKPPSDLDRRRERRLERRTSEPGEAEEAALRQLLECPDTQPCRSRSASARSARRSLACRVSGAGKYRTTSGSAFSAANGALSLTCQRRNSRRSVRSSDIVRGLQLDRFSTEEPVARRCDAWDAVRTGRL
jgi:hypothetical protein